MVHRKKRIKKKKKVPGERREITLGVESRGISKIIIDGMARNDQISRKINAENSPKMMAVIINKENKGRRRI